MHEISICEGILSILEDNAKTQGYNKVKTVWLEIGELAGIEIEALRFGFDVVTQHSIAKDSRLEIITIPGVAWCMSCAKNVNVNQKFQACPDCGSYQLQITGGDQMRIKELEVD